jgi:hypothetical protein
MKKLLAMFALCALALTGCKTVAEIPDEQFADGIHTLTYNSTYYGFKAVLNNNPGRYAQLSADVKTTTDIIRTNVLPVFTGATTGDVLVGAVNTALAQLSVSSTVADTIKVALALVETQVHLPTNPAEKLDVRTKLALLAFFSGVAEGLDQAVKDTPAPAPPTARAIPVAPTTLRWENRK